MSAVRSFLIVVCLLALGMSIVVLLNQKADLQQQVRDERARCTTGGR